MWRYQVDKCFLKNCLEKSKRLLEDGMTPNASVKLCMRPSESRTPERKVGYIPVQVWLLQCKRAVKMMMVDWLLQTRSIWKMLGLFATASRRYIAIHQVSLQSHASYTCSYSAGGVRCPRRQRQQQRQRQRVTEGTAMAHGMGPISIQTLCLVACVMFSSLYFSLLSD